MWRVPSIIAVALTVGMSGAMASGAGAAALPTSSIRSEGPTIKGWDEADWCSPRRPIGHLARSYDPANPRPTLLALAQRRYPPGVAVIENATNERLLQWIRPIPGTPNDFANLQMFFATVVHEEGHMLAIPGANPPSVFAYRIVDDSTIVFVKGIEVYQRSAILRVHPSPRDDPYVPLYLKGPMGGQDIEMLVEEFVQYVHSLAAGYCGLDLPKTRQVSYRDGVLTMMWWLQMYLAVGRKDFPSHYRTILSNRELVKVILDTWERAEYWLVKTAGSRYGIKDADLLKRVYAPANMAEINRLRASR